MKNVVGRIPPQRNRISFHRGLTVSFIIPPLRSKHQDIITTIPEAMLSVSISLDLSVFSLDSKCEKSYQVGKKNYDLFSSPHIVYTQIISNPLEFIMFSAPLILFSYYCEDVYFTGSDSISDANNIVNEGMAHLSPLEE